MWQSRQEINNRIRTIPKKNKEKFQLDLLYLIELAHEDDYGDFEF